MTLHIVAISDLEILHLIYVYGLAVYFKLYYSMCFVDLKHKRLLNSF